MALEQFIRVVRESASWDTARKRRELLPVLRNAPSGALISTTLDDGNDPLQSLDPAHHSLAYLFVLVARMAASTAPDLQLLQYSVRFAESFDRKQIFIYPQKMREFGSHLTKMVDAAEQPLAAVLPLKYVCEKWSEPYGNKGHQLTPMHAHLTKYCILSKAYATALPILDSDIDEVEPQKFDLQYQDFLLYHYYGGIIYATLKRFERAARFFRLCVVAPAPTVASAIQVEAYRKLILVSLIINGRAPALPKYVNNAVVRACKSYASSYTEFAQSFASLNAARLENEFRKHQEEFVSHNNRGLALQCLQALTRKNIQQLTETYITLSLTDIAKAANLADAAEAERRVLSMIQEGQIAATISQRDGGMVSFQDTSESYDAVATMRKIDADAKCALAVAQKIMEMDRDIGSSKEYLLKVVQNERTGNTSSGAGGQYDEMMTDD
ncbi:COP9 signalosome complex subunit 3 [Gaertneriomyces sp. JEL0708]|nr:COP9 signalosome complex subunit 3 [Gaertneriomyces sp. JEL0708]